MERTFSEIVAEELKASGMSRYKLARESGVSEGTLRGIEDGGSTSVERAHAILSALGVRMVIGSETSRRRVA